MTNIHNIARYILTHDPSSRSAYYRSRHELHRKCSQIKLDLLPLSDAERLMASHLSKFAPLESDDFESPTEQKCFQKMSEFSNDRAFFEMLLAQDKLWGSFADRTLKEFIESLEGRKWFEQYEKLKRKPRFELEIPYYPTRARSLIEEIHLKRILRENPLLRFTDVKSMGFKNAQPIMERFPHLNRHRERYLKQLAASPARLKSLQRES